MRVSADFSALMPILERKPKRMLELTDSSVHVNFSSLDIIQTCLRKSRYVLGLGLKKESAALDFGTAIHKALEAYYGLPAGFETVDRLAAAQDRFGVFWGNSGIPETDKRSYKNGRAILDAYAKTYADEEWVIVSDGLGPMIERSFEFEMGKVGNRTLFYHGTIDMVMRNTTTRETVLVDHKTTSTLGNDFMKRSMMSTQFQGYIAGARGLGVETDTFMTNGIGVFKGEKKFLRHFNEFDTGRMTEFAQWALYHTGKYIEAVESNYYPISAPSPCAQWGGCQFIEACSAPLDQRENIIRGLYENIETTPGLSDLS